MFDELVLLKELVGDLSKVGGWMFGAYIAYSLVKLVIIAGSLGYLANKLVTLTYEHIKCPVTKSDYQNIKDRNLELTRDIENIKHKYRIMMEANNAKRHSTATDGDS